MQSTLPKVLHALAGAPLLRHVVNTAKKLNPHAIHVVVGHEADAVRAAFSQESLRFHEQADQLGTGHAVIQAIPHCQPDSIVLVLYGDVPLIQAETLSTLCEAATQSPAMLSVLLENPEGYGRVVRDAQGEFQAVVEDKDATQDQRHIKEVNTGILAAPASLLTALLKQVTNTNQQREYYLPEILALARADGLSIPVHTTSDIIEVLGVNDRLQLEELERAAQRRQAETLMRQGVAISDRRRIDIRGELICGEGVSVDVNTVFEGRVVLGDGVKIGAHCVLKDTEIAAGSVIEPFCHIESAVIGQNCQVGPYARLRTGTRLDPTSKVGNFVETKNTKVGEGSKANHLAYLGDADIGVGANIGAGTITCNYDGANKHPTRLGDRVFVGSNSTLVAPVVIEDDGFVGAGSVITDNVTRGELAVGRARQRNISGWQPPKKN
jgi:bifunctional UDP-N-acetylglucosamine pyrophosphorylase/glucosamine-1-phosphate N-acetyltransferase